MLIVSIIYLCFYITAKVYTKDERMQGFDWSTWLARGASVLSMVMVIVFVIIQDKNASVFFWPPNNLFTVTGLYMVVPINWMILDGTIR